MNYLSAEQLAKRFSSHVVFQGVQLELNSGDCLAITGANGSGKSTLIKTLAGYSIPNLGRIFHRVDGRDIPAEEFWQHHTFTAPYQELYLSLTLRETWNWWIRLRGLDPQRLLSAVDFCEASDLPQRALDQPLAEWSSGMLQRLKLGLIFQTPTAFAFLDEPLSNLDRSGRDWFKTRVALLRAERPDQIIVVASNHDTEETHFCTRQVDVDSYK